MTLQQIAEKIKQNDWAFTIHQTQPTQKTIAKHAHKVGDIAKFIIDLVKENKSEEIQIVPEQLKNKTYVNGFAKTITINFKKKPMESNDPQFTALAGLQNMGLNMAEIFTAKEKSNELQELKQKFAILENDNKVLERDNMKLENKIEMADLKKAQSNQLLEVVKSPQVMTLMSALLTKNTAPALGSPAPQAQPETNPKIQYLVNFLELESTPEAVKDFFIFMIKAHQDENAETILKELAKVLAKHNILQPKKQAE